MTQAGRWREKPYAHVQSSLVAGDFAYFANGLVFTVLDIIDPSNPVVVREEDLPADVGEGEILSAEGYLFVPLTNGTLKIYDLADPSHPSEVASLGGFTLLRGGMELYGGLLYAADGLGGGLRIVGLSPIDSPSIIGTLPLSDARDVTVYEKAFTKYAYVADYSVGLQVVNVTNPAAPVLLATLPLGEGVESVARLGTTLYVADGTSGLRIFSLANPALPAEVGSLPSNSYSEWLEIQGSLGFLCDGFAGLRIVDLSTPESPVLLGGLDTHGYTCHLSLSGTLAGLSDDYGGIRLLDLTNPSAPLELSCLDHSEELTLTLWTDGSRGLAGRFMEGTATFDLTSPAVPVERGLFRIPTGGWQNIRHVAAVANTAYICAMEEGLWTADFSDLSAPSLIGSLDFGDHWVRHAVVVGSLAYVSSWRYGLAVVDVADPANPAEVGRYDSPGRANRAALLPPLAFLADYDQGLRIVDVSNPSTPHEVGHLTFPDHAYGVAASGNLVFVAALGAGLRVVDAGNPSTPVEVGALDTPGIATDVAVSGSVAFVADGSAGVHVVDVSDPSAPVLLDTFDTPGSARSVQLVNDRLYVADTFGFVILDPAPCFSSGVGPFDLLSPAPGYTDAPCSLRLDWENAPGAFRYDLYLDTQNPPLTLAASNLTASQWDAEGLAAGTTFFWKVVARNPGGTAESAIFSFTTAPLPGPFDLQYPLNATAGHVVQTRVCWTVSEGAASYRLYLGTENPPPLHTSGIDGTCLDLWNLQPGQTYYWTVTAVTPCGERPASCGVWSFTTTCAVDQGLWPQERSESLYSFTTDGAYAYFTNGLNLEAVDLSIPSAPERRSFQPLSSLTHEGEPLLYGGFLYLPLGTEIKIFDLSDPAHPREKGRITGFSGLRGGMEVYGNRLYIADEGAGLRIVDLSDPLHPLLLGTFTAPGIRDVAVFPRGSTLLAYIGGLEAPDLEVVDVSDPANPLLLAEIPTVAPGEDPSIESVVRDGDFLYLAAGDWGFRTFSLADPVHPAPLSVFPAGNYLEWAEIQGSFAFLCDASLGLRILSVSDPANPVEVGFWPNPADTLWFVKMSGNTAYLANGSEGLRILDLSNPSAPFEVGFYDAFPGPYHDIASDGTHAFLQFANGALQIFDVSAPPAVVPMGSLPPTPTGTLRSLTLSGNLLLLSDDTDGLRLVDVSDPSAPVVSSLYLPGHRVVHAAVEGRYAYIASGVWGLDVVDIDDPSSPFSVGRYNGDPPGARVRWTSLSWPYAYVADGTGGLRILDVSNSGDPVEVGAAATPSYAYGVAAMDGYALVAAGSAGLRIFDVRTPSSPVEVASVPSNWCAFVQVSGSVAAVPMDGVVRLLDVSDPAAPVFLGTIDTVGGPRRSQLDSGALWAVTLLGLVREDLSTCCTGPPGTPSLIYPANGATVPGGIRLDWSDAPWALRYDVYLDTFNPPSTRVLEGRRLSFGNLGLTPNTTYYWKVVARGPCGDAESEVFSFTTEPYDLAVALFSDAPDPILSGQKVTYTVDVANQSPYTITEAWADLDLSLPPGMTVSFEAAESHPFWAFNPPGHIHISLNGIGGNTTLSLPAVFTVEGTGFLGAHLSVATTDFEPDLSDNSADTATRVEGLSVGDRVFLDGNGNGLQDPGEMGLAGVRVQLFDEDYQPIREALTDTTGTYRFRNLSYGAAYFVKFHLPSPDFAFSPRDQGADDTADSDADTFAGQTDFFTLTSGLDPTRWDCGMVPGASCTPPDEPVYIYSVTLTTDGNDYPILHFMDPNQPTQVTGYNVYRSHDASLPPSGWTLVATDIVDMDEGTPNKQWVDTSGDDPPPGYTVWYYEVAAFNHHCPAEGPW